MKSLFLQPSDKRFINQVAMQSHTLRDNLREAYDKFAQEREASTMEDWKTGERSSFLSALQKENKKKLLEIGAGTGRDSKYFQNQGFEVVCIDLSPAMIELCRQKGLTAYVMDMSNIDFPEDSFEAVYALNSLLHLTKDEFPEILHRINTLLSADGLVYIGVYGGYDHEGVWDHDSYIPKRFFSFFFDENLEHEVSRVFDILTFNRVFFEPDDPSIFNPLSSRRGLPNKMRADAAPQRGVASLYPETNPLSRKNDFEQIFILKHWRDRNCPCRSGLDYQALQVVWRGK